MKERLISEACAMADRSAGADSRILEELVQSLAVRDRGGKLEASCVLSGKSVAIAFDERQLDAINSRRLILTLTRIGGAAISESLIEMPTAKRGVPWDALVILAASMVSCAVFWNGDESFATLSCLIHLSAASLIFWRGAKCGEICALALMSSVSAVWNPSISGIYFFVVLIFMNLSAKMDSETFSRARWIAFHALLAGSALLFRPDLTRFSAPIEPLSLSFRGAALTSTFAIASYYWFSAPGRGPLHFRICISLFIFCLLAPYSPLLYMATLLIAWIPLTIRQFMPR